MNELARSASFREHIGQVRARLVQRLKDFQPGPRTFITAFCVGTTIGEYAALAGATTPEAIMAATVALSAQLGANLLADIIGDREPPPGLTVDEIAEAVQARLERGDDLQAVRALLQELDLLHAALEAWQRTDERLIQLVDELSRHPQLIAAQVTQDVVKALDPHLAGLEERIAWIEALLRDLAQNLNVLRPQLPPLDLPEGLLSAFVSSVVRELRPERRIVADAIRSLALVRPWLFEEEPPSPRALPEAYLRYVRRCDIFILVIGHDITDPVYAEYETAHRCGKPMLIFFREGLAPSEAVAAFRQQLEQDGSCKYATFRDNKDLARQVRNGVALHIIETYRDHFSSEQLRENLFPYADDEVLLAEYRAEVARRYALMDLSGVPHHPQVPLPMDDLYIRLHLLEQHPGDEIPGEVGDDPRAWVQRQARMAVERRREWAERFRWRSTSGSQPEAVEPEEALERSRRLVVLGEPGAGKSTLLRYLVRRLALRADGPVPILASLGPYAHLMARGEHKPLLDYILDGVTRPWGRWGERLRDSLYRVLQDGQAVLLLDGLDEAARYQAAVAQEVVRLPAWDSGRIVITSRPLPYWQAGKPSEFGTLAHYELLPLEPDQALPFAQAWLTQVARHRGYSDEWTQKRLDWLKQQLTDNPLTQEAATNPLLLTFLVILAGRSDRQGRPLPLPTRRSELYRAYIEGRGENEALLSAWERERSEDKRLTIGHLEGDEAASAAIEGLFVIAFQLQRGYFGGGKPEEVFWDNAKQGLARFYQGEWEMGRRQADTQAEAVLGFWLRTGLLISHEAPGGKALSFRHLSFQEYGAARRLEALGPNHPAFREALRWDGWDEALVLLADFTAHLDVLIERLLPLDPFLAARCAGVRADAISPATADRLVTSLTRLAEDIYSPWREEAIVALGISHRREAIPALIQLLQDEEWLVRRAAAQALGKLEASEAIPSLIQLLQDEAWFVRRAAAEALGKLEAREAIPTLIQLLQDEAWPVRQAAAEALGKLEASEAIPALIQLLQDEAWPVRQAAALALEKLEASEAIPSLIQLLQDEEWFVRQVAKQTLGKLWTRDDIPALIQLLQDEEWLVRQAAKQTLGKLWTRDDIPALIQLLQDEAGFVRRTAAEALGKLEAREAIPALIQLLQDEAGFVRRTAAEALGKLE
ncbi:MAG: DUF4062 domain-containing protein, partial [Chloroflexi bacterium]|nr:DUF4062 domain-containing protein [Chloroflexota bacterium]